MPTISDTRSSIPKDEIARVHVQIIKPVVRFALKSKGNKRRASLLFLLFGTGSLATILQTPVERATVNSVFFISDDTKESKGFRWKGWKKPPKSARKESSACTVSKPKAANSKDDQDQEQDGKDEDRDRPGRGRTTTQQSVGRASSSAFGGFQDSWIFEFFLFQRRAVRRS